jgi:hypothetical protein
MARSVGKTESRKVGGHEMKVASELRDQIPKHVAGSWKSVQKQNRRLLRIARLPIKKVEATDAFSFKRNKSCIHGGLIGVRSERENVTQFTIR